MNDLNNNDIEVLKFVTQFKYGIGLDKIIEEITYNRKSIDVNNIRAICCKLFKLGIFERPIKGVYKLNKGNNGR